MFLYVNIFSWCRYEEVNSEDEAGSGEESDVSVLKCGNLA